MADDIEKMASRIIELETRLAFQDDTIEELNGALINQQLQLDRLGRDFKLIKERLDRLLAAANDHHDR